MTRCERHNGHVRSIFPGPFPVMALFFAATFCVIATEASAEAVHLHLGNSTDSRRAAFSGSSIPVTIIASPSGDRAEVRAEWIQVSGSLVAPLPGEQSFMAATTKTDGRVDLTIAVPAVERKSSFFLALRSGGDSIRFATIRVTVYPANLLEEVASWSRRNAFTLVEGEGCPDLAQVLSGYDVRLLEEGGGERVICKFSDAAAKDDGAILVITVRDEDFISIVSEGRGQPVELRVPIGHSFREPELQAAFARAMLLALSTRYDKEK